MPIPDRFRSAERQILRVKAELRRISRDRLVAYRDRRLDEAARQQVRLLEAELQNIQALAAYVKAVSPAAARELASRHAAAAQRFGELKGAGDAVALQAWLRDQLAPLVNKSEQAAHLVATTLRLEKERKSRPFRWRARDSTRG